MTDNYIIFTQGLTHASAGSVYKLAILAAKRALEIADGQPILTAHPAEKLLETAFREINEGKVKTS